MVNFIVFRFPGGLDPDQVNFQPDPLITTNTDEPAELWKFSSCRTWDRARRNVSETQV